MRAGSPDRRRNARRPRSGVVAAIGEGDCPVHERAGRGRFRVAALARALEQELDHVSWQSAEGEDGSLDPNVHLPQVRLSLAEIKEQLREMLGDDAE